MAHPIINSDTADHLFGALCNTLLHSLWQGILLAAIAGIIIISTRKSTSALRYNLLVSALLAFTIGVGITFAWQYQATTINTHFANAPVMHINSYANHPEPQPVHIFINGRQQQVPGFTTQLSNYLTDHHNTIVLIWFLIVCARSLQLGFGLYATRRLRRAGVVPVNGDWKQRFEQLAHQLGIIRSVTLLESALAKVPMVIGHLKPVVLVPVGLLTALSAEEVEAILVHELAHIKRRDYLVNMLQSLVEIVLFFNPAVLWVSKLIKTERENCCDDLAVAQNNNKISYIRALVSCEEYRASVPAYAMGLPGSKNTLLHRVQRMVNNSNNSLNLFEKTVLAVCLVALGLGVSAFTAREHIAKALKSVAAAIHHPKTDGITAKHDTTKKKQSAPVNNVDNMVSKLQQGPNRVDSFKNDDRKALDLLKFKIDSLQVNPDNFKSPQQFLTQGSSTNNFKAPQFFSQQGADNFKWQEKPDTNFFKWNKWKYKPFQEITRELYHEHIVTDTNHMSITLNEKELIVNGVRMSKELHDRIYKKYGTNTGTTSGTYNSDYKDNNQKIESDDKTKNIIRDMMKDGIITDTDDLSFKIGTTEFVVNYKKQSEAVYQKYRAKYVPGRPKGDWIWFYQFDTSKWDQMTGRKSNEGSDGTATGVFQGKEDANSGDANGYNNGNPTGYQTDAYKPRDWDAYSRQRSAEQQRVEAERDKKLVADLMQDALITDPKNVTFTLTDKKLTVNGKKQSNDLYNKYKDKYMPDNTGSGWSWTYSHHE